MTPEGAGVLSWVLAAIMTQMERNFSTFEEAGFAALKPQYLQHWMHSHTTVSLSETDRNGRKVKVGLPRERPR